jgi:hypothetical protein
MGGDILNLLGVIMTISLAVCTKLHSEINRLEATYKKIIYKKTRRSISLSVFSLVIIFLLSFALLATKGYFIENLFVQSIINLILTELVLLYVWILIDFIRMSFTINADEYLGD